MHIKRKLNSWSSMSNKAKNWQYFFLMIGKNLLAKYMLATMQKGLFEEVMTIIDDWF